MGDVIAELTVADHIPLGATRKQSVPLVQIVGKPQYEADFKSGSVDSGNVQVVLELEGTVESNAEKLAKLTGDAGIRLSDDAWNIGSAGDADIIFPPKYATSINLAKLAQVVRGLGGEDVTSNYFPR